MSKYLLEMANIRTTDLSQGDGTTISTMSHRARDRIGCQATRSQESTSQAQDEEGDKKSNS